MRIRFDLNYFGQKVDVVFTEMMMMIEVFICGKCLKKKALRTIGREDAQKR